MITQVERAYFPGVSHAPRPKGWGRRDPKMFETYMHAHGMRISNQILHDDDQSR